MALIALKCPNCNGDIQLDDKNEFGFCMYCGCKVMIENQLRNVSLDRSTEHINLLRLSKNEIASRNWVKASELIERSLVIDSNSSDAWLMKALVARTNGDSELYSRCIEYANRPESSTRGIFDQSDLVQFWGECTVTISYASATFNSVKAWVSIDGKDEHEFTVGQSFDYGTSCGNHVITIKYILYNKAGNPVDQFKNVETIIESDCKLDIKQGMFGFKLVPGK